MDHVVGHVTTAYFMMSRPISCDTDWTQNVRGQDHDNSSTHSGLDQSNAKKPGADLVKAWCRAGK